MQDREMIICGDRSDEESSTEKTGLAPLRWQDLSTERQKALLDLMSAKPW
jgi:hypothetical protein